MKEKALIYSAITFLCLVFLINTFTYKNFHRMYHPKNDLVTNFLQLNQTNLTKSKEIIAVNPKIKSHLNQKLPRNLRQLSLNKENLQYVYTFHSKQKVINVDIFVPQNPNIIGTMSATISAGDTFTLHNFEAREALSNTEFQLEQKSLRYLKEIFAYLAEQSANEILR